MSGCRTFSTSSRRYTVYRSTAFGAISFAAEVEAECDSQALRQARALITDGDGELREGHRIVCRFGSAQPFMLHD